MPRLLAVADRGRGAAVGDRADEVGLDRGLAGELDADAAAGLVDRLAADHAVGAGEVDLLEDAEARLRRLEREEALDALGGGDHHLAGLDLADELGADDVEGAGLRGEHPGRRRAGPSISGRTPSGSRTPISLERVMATIEKAPSTRRSASFIRSGMVFWIERAIRWMMHSVSEPDWKIEPRSISSSRKRERVGQVAVVGDGGAAHGELGEERLDVADLGVALGAGGRVADVADGERAGQGLHQRWRR